MFFEYAVEPEALSTWQRARYLLDALRPEKGRFICDLPKGKWKRLIYQSLINCPEIEKARVAEKLKQLQTSALVRRTDSYDDQKSWIENAESSHRQTPFKAIIVATAGKLSHHINSDDVDESHPLWTTSSGAPISKTVDAFVNCATCLIRVSQRVILIDPHFRPGDREKRSVLEALSKKVLSSSAKLELVVGDDLSYDELKRQVTKDLPKHLPSGIEVTIHQIAEKAGGARVHNRYILTNRSGLQFGDGLEEGPPGHGDRVSILDATSHQQYWTEHTTLEANFAILGPALTVVGKKAIK